MRFQFDGRDYAIEFRRDHKSVEPPKQIRLLSSNKPASRYPYTTVYIVEIDPVNPENRRTYREATVGCWHKEKTFTLENGRLHALRAVGKSMKAGFKKAMWDAYMSRTKTSNLSLPVDAVVLPVHSMEFENDSMGG